MIRADAEGIVGMLEKAWDKALGDAWVDSVMGLDDAGVAGACAVKMRNADRRHRDFGTLQAAYALAMRDKREQEPRCEYCDGTGMVPVDARGGGYLAESEPCPRCAEGVRRQNQIDQAGASHRPNSRKLDQATCAIGLDAIARIRAAQGWGVPRRGAA